MRLFVPKSESMLLLRNPSFYAKLDCALFAMNLSMIFVNFIKVFSGMYFVISILDIKIWALFGNVYVSYKIVFCNGFDNLHQLHLEVHTALWE